MSWQFLDHNFWQTIIAACAIGAAYVIGTRQIKIQDIVELYGSYGFIVNKSEKDEIVSTGSFIHIQNVGTRLIYLDKYVFNGRVYITDGQILPPTYSQALNGFYRVELPSNHEMHVSLEVFYHDVDNRFWSSMIIAEKTNAWWEIKTLPRKSVNKY